MKKRLVVAMVGALFLGLTSLAQADFVGSKDSDKYHTMDCPIVKNIKEANKVIFKTAAEAQKAGYKACKKCQPGETAAVDAKFVASKDGEKYHMATCKLVAHIKDGNKVGFTTKEEAQKAGYKPCTICWPPEKKEAKKEKAKKDKIEK